MLGRAGGGRKQTHALTGIELQVSRWLLPSFFCLLGKGLCSLACFHNRNKIVTKKKKRKNQPFEGSGEQQTQCLVGTCEDRGVERSSCPLKLRNSELGSLCCAGEWGARLGTRDLERPICQDGHVLWWVYLGRVWEI